MNVRIDRGLWPLLLSLALVLLLPSCGGGGGGEGDTPPTVPAAPSGVTAAASPGSATIIWSVVTDATSYNIYYSTTTPVPKATATKITGVTSPRVVNGLTNGTTYHFVVTAVNTVGESADSTQVSATPTLAPPAAPTGVAATAGNREATINWNAVAGATSYNIYYSTTPGVTKATGDRITGVTSPKTVPGLINYTTYYFVVTATNAMGESAESGQVFALPIPSPAPTGVTASAGDREATISWLPVTGATSYNIYYSTTSGVTKATGIKIPNVTSPKVVTPLSNGTTWYFVVTAQNADGESVESGQVSAVPILNPPPTPPTGVTAMAGPGQATISWLTGSTSYNIYYSTTPGVTKATGIKIPNVTSPRIVTPLASGTTYYFVVTAQNADGESNVSSEVSATPFVEYIAIGDSITFGQGDHLDSDDTSLDKRNTGGGFEPILNNLLTTEKKMPHSIVNEGVPGATSSGGVNSLPTTLAKYLKANYYLILYGTNDASIPVPTATYKNNVQQMISAISAAGKTPILALIPFTLDPALNIVIQQYNQAIVELVAEKEIAVVPPDFYDWFERHPEQITDTLHPDGFGYQAMANLWKTSLTTP